MNKSVKILGLSLLLSVASGAVMSAETLVDSSDTTKMEISVYNNNMAYVKDTRRADLSAGKNELAFEGVSSQILPETAMLLGAGINVAEQNYNYNLMTPDNIMKASVGKKVKTALYNETTGKTEYNEAEIIEAGSSNPVLKFDYGIETAFPGRIIYSEIPAGLRTKPTLVIDVNSAQAAQDKELELSYLTNGLSWKADYVAEINGDEDLNLTGWITLKNESGTDYENASVQLIAGSVNQVSSYVMRPVMAMRNMKAAGMVAMAEDSAAAPSSEAFADYYLYTLPIKTTLRDNQSKQVSLMNKDNVKYDKIYRLTSPLYLNLNQTESRFEKANPSVIYKLENTKEKGLGEALPKGVVRFFEKDNRGSRQFIGENNLPSLAEGEKTELRIGQVFDVYAQGEVSSAEKIAEDTTQATIEITISNAKNENVQIEYEQNFGWVDWKIISEELKSRRKDASTAQWLIDIPAQSKYVFTYTVRLSKKD